MTNPNEETSLQERIGACRDVAALLALANEVAEADGGAQRLAEVLARGEALAAEVPDAVALAEGILAHLQDREQARKVLDEAQSQCQFPQEFVAVAGAYAEGLGDQDTARDLLEQGAEFAMSAEEHRALAHGYLDALADREQAIEAYRRALAESSGSSELLELAAEVAGALEAPELLGEIYERLESKLRTARDVNGAAAQMLGNGVARPTVAALYERAAARLGAVEDQLALAEGALETLGAEGPAAALYAGVLDSAQTVDACVRIGRALGTGAGDAALAGKALERARVLVGSTGEALAVAALAGELGAGAAGQTGALLEQAEALAGSAEDLKALLEALPEGEEAARARIADKLARRERNQARYAQFQAEEKGLATVRQCLDFARRVRAELDDAEYAGRALARAAEILEAEAFDVDRTIQWLRVLAEIGGDAQRTGRALDDAAAKCTHFAWLRMLARFAAAEPVLGLQAARKLYESREAALPAEGEAGAYARVRLARAVGEDLEDAAWSGRLLDEAGALGSAPGVAVEIALVRWQAGGDRAALVAEFAKALETASAEDCVALLERLRAAGLDAATLHEVYALAGEHIEQPLQRLRWAEGIVDVLGDERWARETYDGLAEACSAGAEAARYAASREARLGRRFFG